MWPVGLLLIIILNKILSKHDVLLIAMVDLGELKTHANDAKIKSLLNFLLVWYFAVHSLGTKGNRMIL